MKDRHSIQLGFASLNRTSIFHLMQNLVPLHDQPLAICILLIEAHFYPFAILSELFLIVEHDIASAGNRKMSVSKVSTFSYACKLGTITPK